MMLTTDFYIQNKMNESVDVEYKKKKKKLASQLEWTVAEGPKEWEEKKACAGSALELYISNNPTTLYIGKGTYSSRGVLLIKPCMP